MYKVLVLLTVSLGFTNNSIAEGHATDYTKFWHLGIVVKDIDGMDDFYTRVLGLERTTDLAFSDTDTVAYSEGVVPVAGLDNLMGIDKTRVIIRHYSDPDHQQFLEFLYYPGHPATTVNHAVNTPLGWNHLGLKIPDMDRVLAIMQSEGLGSIAGGPAILKEFEGNRYVFIKDPEGNLVELYEKAK